MSGGYRGRRRFGSAPDPEDGFDEEGFDDDEFDDDAPPRERLSRSARLSIIVAAAVPTATLGVCLGFSGADRAESLGLPGPPGAVVSTVETPPWPDVDVSAVAEATRSTAPSGAPTTAASAAAPPASAPGPAGAPGQTTAAAGATPGGQAVAGPPPAAPAEATVVPTRPAFLLDNFDSPSAYANKRNDLGEETDAEVFANGGGRGVVAGGGLTLVYDDDGWFGSDVMRDVSAYKYLVIRIIGAEGGEERHMKLTLGGVTRFLGDMTLDGGGHPVVTRSYTDIRIPMTANGINTRSPGEFQLSFWWGGHSSIVIDEIRFE
ncbi:hypothetical protein [Dactylosporangium sp. CA-092794]|uniref:hypothetical protein n=1 Tax=Dactylosporangium sp. CA-092794 TaxID=3239929 RepID=UPI003D90DB16